MNLEKVEKIARAVLYEGYLLYPYRRSALKNRHRWNFGVIYPKDFSSATTGAEPTRMQSECLVEAGDEAMIGARVRFLHLASEKIAETHDTIMDLWYHAVEREVKGPTAKLASLAAAPVTVPFRFEVKEISQVKAGAVFEKRQETLEGFVDIAAAPVDNELFKLTVRVCNLTPFTSAAGAERERALMQSLVSTHIILQALDGKFISLIDPPEKYRHAAQACCNIGAWPVLVGEEGEQDGILAAPIILYDYPQVAPESPGDLFDGTEIDELLTLRILTLTAEEKEQMRHTDARARELLERTEALPSEQLMQLHGAVRGLRNTKKENQA